MISDAQIKQYNEEGYTIVENVFSMDEGYSGWITHNT